MQTDRDLHSLLLSIDRRGYPAYKQTAGSYRFNGYILHIDHVQGDPFASPSHLSIEVPGTRAGFPAEYYQAKHRRIALEDRLCRLFHRAAGKYSHQARGSGKSGAIFTTSPAQEILERSTCHIQANGTVLYRLEVGFPANGRTINAGELIKVLYDFLPAIVQEALYYHENNAAEVRATCAVIELADDQAYIREELAKRGLCAFVADGAILPRQSGVSPLPMKEALPFETPPSLRVELELPHKGKLSGMGIRRGITLIVGGGYHGKSTLLHALELGVYEHIAGDGREYVLTDASAVKIRAEDGRSVHGTDISLFIKDLPNRMDTTRFSTEDASGSTSQAANVVEAMESGTRVLLIDEDTCATNFMIRDKLMQEVIHREQEPITPFIERIRPLWEKTGLSTILVAGSFGAFFHIADTIIQMDRYHTVDITERAKEAAKDYPLEDFFKVRPMEAAPSAIVRRPQPIRRFSAPPAGVSPASAQSGRMPYRGGGRGNAYGNENRGQRIKTKTMGKDSFSIDHETVELRYLEQLVDSGQTAALSRILLYASRHLFDGKRSLTDCVDQIMALLEKDAGALLCEHSYVISGLTLPRRQEIFSCLNRCRFLEIR